MTRSGRSGGLLWRVPKPVGSEDGPSWLEGEEFPRLGDAPQCITADGYEASSVFLKCRLRKGPREQVAPCLVKTSPRRIWEAIRVLRVPEVG